MHAALWIPWIRIPAVKGVFQNLQSPQKQNILSNQYQLSHTLIYVLFMVNGLSASISSSFQLLFVLGFTPSLIFAALKMEMEVYSTGNDGEDGNACKPQFFKIIVSPSIQLRQLRIPAAFVKKSGKSLLDDHASLRGPEGATWKVGLTKRKGDVWFDDGWRDFAKHYSLAFGHFLVFKYQGNSQFQVTIFDKTCTEIEYPNRSAIKDTETGGASNYKSRRRLDNDNGISKPKGVKNRAVERAKAFECSNPHFVIAMQSSFVSHQFHVSVPMSYSREHMKERNKYTISLETATKGKAWPVNCYTTTSELRVRIGAGWKKFVRDNRLRVGDVCLFELIHRGNKAYRVHIFRK